MTTVVVIGGGGAMAQPALRLLARRADLDLVVADVRLPAAEAAARAVGARALGLDVTEPHALRSALEPADLVVNVAGPFFRFAVPILTAAIDTGTHYVDICDDWEPIEEMFDLHDAALASGVTAIIGMGASPGLSNLLAALAVRELDDVVDLFTGWPVDVDFEGGRDRGSSEDVTGLGAAAVHWMQQISGSITTLADGSPVASTPLEPIELTYPNRGRGTAYVVGHPEPIMFRRSLRPSGASANVMVVTDGTIAFLDGLRHGIDTGALTLDEAAAELNRPSPTRVAKAALSSLRKAGPGKLPGFFAIARGSRDGTPKTVGARLVTAPKGMAGVTGIPLAIAAGQVLDGLVSTRGVLGPESSVDPTGMFTELAAYCAAPGSTWTDIVRIDVA
jgi:saccharopine dehydrogenase-like NADP-dependent oxidoreductase